MTTALKPYEGIADLYIIDPDGYMIRKWNSKELNVGVLLESFTLPLYPKGQLISKCSFVAFKSPKIPTKFFSMKKKRSKNQKSSVSESKYNPPISGRYKVPLFFDSSYF